MIAIIAPNKITTALTDSEIIALADALRAPAWLRRLDCGCWDSARESEQHISADCPIVARLALTLAGYGQWVN